MDAKSYYHRFCKLGPVSTKFQVSQKKKIIGLFPPLGFRSASQDALFLISQSTTQGLEKTRDSESLSGRKVSVYPRKKVENFCKYRKK